MTHMLSAIAQKQPFQERLSGELVLDAMGNPAQPSAALPFETDNPVPTMLVQRELNYLHWLASQLQGKGRVVELGCFLGGSTSALAAGLRLNEQSSQPILTYDCFRTAPKADNFDSTWLRPFGLEPDQYFRDRFDRLNRDWIDSIVVREGVLPSDASRVQECELYPEQESIELLFVDVAKTWDIHLTVLRSFARHLKIGSVLIQQDFADIFVPWIPLHMWQLRDVLEPLDVIQGTPTVSFRCIGDVSERLDELWGAHEMEDKEHRQDVWKRVHDYWSELLGSGAAGFLYGHQAVHAYHKLDSHEIARAGRQYDAWSRSSQSLQRYYAPYWSEFVMGMANQLHHVDKASYELRGFEAEYSVRGSRLDRPRKGEETAYYSTKQRMNIWKSALQRLRDDGHLKVALFGAGKHTSWLLNTICFDEIEIVCILDDSPTHEILCGIPVLTPAMAQESLVGVTAVLPSTDSFEPEILARLRVLYQDIDGVVTPRVYTHTDSKLSYTSTAGNEFNNWTYEAEIPQGISELHPHSIQRTVAREVAEREQIGLSPSRDWLDSFYEYYSVPVWAIGYTIQSDAVFLWDLVEHIRPQTTVEIGTASGVSTALILGAVEQFCDEDSLVHSYDVSTRCYFDTDRPIAAALGEMVPDLLSKARLYAPADAVDAATHFGIGEVDFAFIDGDHSHPSPTLDLLSLLYALKPGVWVALHDIELSQLRSASGEREWQHVTGAEKLFHDWPFEKIQAAGSCPEERNIGAIRMPENLEDAVPHLLNLLRKPWETRAQPSPAIIKALAKLAEFDE